MRINHNIAALNTYRQLSANGVSTQKSLEKLSSGLRINRAGDDAAGLAISEKMRSQIRGLDQASRNSQDAISLIQTAEGALSETHSILQRMRELAVQSANDTNTDTDRAEMQKEINQLTSEINRIGNTTEFNTKKLLDGSISSTNGIVTAGSSFDPDATTLTGLTLKEKSTTITAGSYTLSVDDVQTKSITAPSLAQQNEQDAMGISGITIATNSTLDDVDFQINFGETTVKTVAADGSGSTLQGHIDGDVSVQSFSALTGNQTFAANRVDEVTYNATADATNLTGIRYSDQAAIDGGAYSVVVTKEASGLANGTSAGGYVTAVDVAANTAINGADLRMVFQERTDTNSSAQVLAAHVVATDIGADAQMTINVAGVNYSVQAADIATHNTNNNAASLKALFDNAQDADGNLLSSVVTTDTSTANITLDINTGVKGALTLTFAGANAANFATLTGVVSGTTMTNNATDRNEFQVRLYDAAQSKFVSDAVILDDAQQNYDFAASGTAIGVSFTTDTDVNTALNTAGENGKYQIFDIDTKLTVNQGVTELANDTLAAGAAAGTVNIAGFDIDFGAVDTLAAGTASYTVDNNLSYVWGGDFGVGGNDVEVATLEGGAVNAAQSLAGLNAGTSLTISVDGTDFIVNNADLKGYTGAGTITDLQNLIKNADTVGDGSGTKLSDIATVSNDGTAISIAGRLFGADGDVTWSVTAGVPGDTATLATAFGIADAATADGVGGASTSFDLGDAITLAGGVSLTSSADLADYSAGGETSTIDIDSTAGYVATLQDDLGAQVAGTSQVVVSANGSYTLGKGVSFTTGAGPLAAGDATFTVDSDTSVNATLTNGGSFTETLEDISATTTLSFANGEVTANIAALTNGDATFTVTGAVSDDSMSMQIGANSGQNFSISVDDIRANSLGISGTVKGAAAAVTGAFFTDGAVGDVTNDTGAEWALDVSSSAKATAAIEVLDDSITAVSAERSKLGAYQNRLEHTINNLGASAENLTAAESRIRDVDMAKEMMEFTKNNILSQAATAMLAQANQQPQSVLQLLG